MWETRLLSLINQVQKLEQSLNDFNEQTLEDEFCKKLARLFKWVLSFKFLIQDFLLQKLYGEELHSFAIYAVVQVAVLENLL